MRVHFVTLNVKVFFYSKCTLMPYMLDFWEIVIPMYQTLGKKDYMQHVELMKCTRIATKMWHLELRCMLDYLQEKELLECPRVTTKMSVTFGLLRYISAFIDRSMFFFISSSNSTWHLLWWLLWGHILPLGSYAPTSKMALITLHLITLSLPLPS